MSDRPVEDRRAPIPEGRAPEHLILGIADALEHFKLFKQTFTTNLSALVTAVGGHGLVGAAAVLPAWSLCYVTQQHTQAARHEQMQLKCCVDSSGKICESLIASMSQQS
jgi:hypothetical protein